MRVSSFNSIGSLVKEYRIKKKWSQVDLSHETGLKDKAGQQISNIERGISNLPPKHGSKFCEVLGIDPSLMIDAMMNDFKKSLVEKFKSP